MKENFANYEQSLTLKELGFDEVCLKLYVDKELGGSLKPWAYQHSVNSNILCAPLISQVFTFFREKYNLDGFLDSVGGKNGYFYIVQDILTGNKVLESDLATYTYQEAQTAVIDKLIEISQKDEK